MNNEDISKNVRILSVKRTISPEIDGLPIDTRMKYLGHTITDTERQLQNQISLQNGYMRMKYSEDEANPAPRDIIIYTGIWMEHPDKRVDQVLELQTQLEKLQVEVAKLKQMATDARDTMIKAGFEGMARTLLPL